MFDMNQCEVGDKIVSVHGTVFTYGGLNHSPYAGPFRHVVFYPNGVRGTRTDTGEVFQHNKRDTDEDIVGFYRGD